ncbi:MAG: aspartate carbamoyltransferase regulatory subunit [Candidatus Heimdallarchaeota archaeon]|nr:aspartate carbamoyltransferase regulatory subunit [Candidatus Heimdallarchaeota archaeon]
MTDEPTMLVSKIDAGTVIDKIPAGLSLPVLRALDIREGDTKTVAVAIRVNSESMGKKDIVKLTHRFLNEDELTKIWLIAPNAQISIIREYQVAEKYEIYTKVTSDEFTGVLQCDNPSCATNYNEPVTGHFQLMQRDPMLVRCLYCDRVMLEDNIKDQL